jgi:hypothetical protein
MYDKTPLEMLDFHRSMLVDEERCLGYMRAILQTVRRGDVPGSSPHKALAAANQWLEQHGETGEQEATDASEESTD